MTYSPRDMEISLQQLRKKHFLGTSRCLRGIHILKHQQQIHSGGHFEGSTNFLRSVVHEIWFLCSFGTLGSSFGPKNRFHPPFSLITNLILKIDPLSIPKQLLSWSLQKGSLSLFEKLGQELPSVLQKSTLASALYLHLL